MKVPFVGGGRGVCGGGVVWECTYMGAWLSVCVYVLYSPHWLGTPLALHG